MSNQSLNNTDDNNDMLKQVFNEVLYDIESSGMMFIRQSFLDQNSPRSRSVKM
jgi:hypothetical protein